MEAGGLANTGVVGKSSSPQTKKKNYRLVGRNIFAPIIIKSIEKICFTEEVLNS